MPIAGLFYGLNALAGTAMGISQGINADRQYQESKEYNRKMEKQAASDRAQTIKWRKEDKEAQLASETKSELERRKAIKDAMAQNRSQINANNAANMAQQQMMQTGVLQASVVNIGQAMR